ncbi:conserved hypothetical protein [Aeromonas veronii]|uniref:Uncharacterized protein n=1 Tax=Aeromonas veronii TaxID=654 RepID=A0A653KVK7_AERVE|nr:conserved hypothetical protein [Aeromonas veronii]
MSEWLKEHAWKVCIRQRIEGSNPSLTAKLQSPDGNIRAFCYTELLYRRGEKSTRESFGVIHGCQRPLRSGEPLSCK